jgi:hypothetical protein
MLRELRSWALWQTGLGLVNIFATGDAPWACC